MNNFGKLSFAEAIGLVETRLREAAWTLDLIHTKRHDLPDGYSSSWPKVVHDWSAYGGEVAKQRQKDAVNRSPLPSPEALDRMDQAMMLLWAVKHDDRSVVMGRAAGASWRGLEDRDGRCVSTLKTVYTVALEAMFIRAMEKE